MNISDITPELVAEAYRKNDLLPKSCNLLPNIDRKCCALGALGNGFYVTFGAIAQYLCILEIDAIEFAYGFDDGFDGTDMTNYAKEVPSYSHGYEVGVAIRKEFNVPLREV